MQIICEYRLLQEADQVGSFDSINKHKGSGFYIAYKSFLSSDVIRGRRPSVAVTLKFKMLSFRELPVQYSSLSIGTLIRL